MHYNGFIDRGASGQNDGRICRILPDNYTFKVYGLRSVRGLLLQSSLPRLQTGTHSKTDGSRGAAPRAVFSLAESGGPSMT